MTDHSRTLGMMNVLKSPETKHAIGMTPLAVRMMDLQGAADALKKLPKTFYSSQIEDILRDMENDLKEYEHSLEYSNGYDPHPNLVMTENVDGRV